ncbi:hypothetical protein D3Z55_06155 [Clostridiaceae bacterium]|nr:hypothetical protein [Clostridiaceae bacterium]
MLRKKYNKKTRKKTYLLGVLFIAGVLTSCTQRQKADGEQGNKESLVLETAAIADQGTEDTTITTELIQSESTAHSAKSTQSETEAKTLKEQFGEACIPEQTFEVELSEYKGKIWFVSYAPTEDGQGLHVQIIQNGEILADIPVYVPEKIAEKGFKSLDAVSFYDVNYDNNTDIVLISTYGNTSFATFYYGFAENGDNRDKYFIAQELLSQNISDQVNPLSISEIRTFLSEGTRNGSFNSYQEAYQAVSRLYEAEGTDSIEYGLIYFDEDEILELIVGVRGYYTSLYTYQNGTIYTLMDRWPYGAMGNAGYEYAPKRNSLRNYNTDFAGAILYTTYMAADIGHSMNTVVEIKTYNFDDSNGNGIPDENEMESIGKYSISYINDEKVGEEAYASYDVGGYEYMEPDMSWEQLKEALERV